MTFGFKNKGLIALDVDGTVVEGKNPPSKEVQEGLRELYDLGWKIAFITGRPLGWVKGLLKDLNFPFDLAVQNGALALSYPGERLLFRHTVDPDKVSTSLPFVSYVGDEKDTVFWKPMSFSPELRSYLIERFQTYGENWVEGETKGVLTSLKWFGGEEEMAALSFSLEEQGFHAAYIRDPFHPEVFIVQATHPQANKGDALKELSVGVEGKIIAAGDDRNDLLLFNEADFSIAMPQAPSELIEAADRVADKGLIQALKDAIV